MLQECQAILQNDTNIVSRNKTSDALPLVHEITEVRMSVGAASAKSLLTIVTMAGVGTQP